MRLRRKCFFDEKEGWCQEEEIIKGIGRNDLGASESSRNWKIEHLRLNL